MVLNHPEILSLGRKALALIAKVPEDNIVVEPREIGCHCMYVGKSRVVEGNFFYGHNYTEGRFIMTSPTPKGGQASYRVGVKDGQPFLI